jgi:hypothetical protein
VRAEGVVWRDRGPKLGLLGQRQLRDVGETALFESRQLLAIERGALEEVLELGAVTLGVSART